jgi:hypothetical protein
MSLVTTLMRRRPAVLLGVAEAVLSAAPPLPFRSSPPARSWALTPFAAAAFRRAIRGEMIRALEEHEREVRRERRLRLARRSLAIGAIAAAAAGGMRLVGHTSASHDA